MFERTSCRWLSCRSWKEKLIDHFILLAIILPTMDNTKHDGMKISTCCHSPFYKALTRFFFFCIREELKSRIRAEQVDGDEMRDKRKIKHNQPSSPSFFIF